MAPAPHHAVNSLLERATSNGVARAHGVLEPSDGPRELVFVPLRLDQRLCMYAHDWICFISRFELTLARRHSTEG